jgi:phage-related protein
MAAGPQGWQVDDWRGPSGARPVRAFINDLSKPAKAKVIAALQMLEEHGHRLQLPHSRALGSGLQELRIAHPEGPFRVIYCYLPGAQDRAATCLRETNGRD